MRTRMAKTASKLWRGRRGAAMLEFALVLWVLVLLAAGIWDLGRVYDAWLVATNASREGARWAARGEGLAAVQTRVANYIATGTAGRSDVYFSSGEVTLVLDDGSGDPGDPVTVTVPVRVELFMANVIPAVLRISEPCGAGGSATCLKVYGRETMRLQQASAP